MLEMIANLKWYWVILVVCVLLAVRFALRNSKNSYTKQVAEIAESLAIAVGLVFLIIRPFIVQAFFIPSASMHMTLVERDHILVNKFLYRFIREPRRGDIVVFKAPPEASHDGMEHDFIKRLIGQPGETIRVEAGYVDVGDIRLTHMDLRELLNQYGSSDQYGTRARIEKDGVLINDRKVTAKQIALALDKHDTKVKFHPGTVYINGKPLTEAYMAEDPDGDFPTTTIGKDHLFMMGDNRNNSSDSRFWGQLERSRVLGKSMFIFWPLNRLRWVK